jgi:single-strand DNA-binding protein
MYLNKAIVIGNLTRDPELRSLPSGAAVTSFSIATTRVWKDKAGAKQEDTQFHNVVVFGAQAHTVAQYLKKGSSALVEGRMQTRSWDSPEGKKYRTEIVADRVQFGPRRDGAAPASAEGGSQGSASASASAAPALGTIEYPEEEINPEEIPF